MTKRELLDLVKDCGDDDEVLDRLPQGLGPLVVTLPADGNYNLAYIERVLEAKGFGKALVIPHGMTVKRVMPYYYRRKAGSDELEVGFAAYAEMIGFLESQDEIDLPKPGTVLDTVTIDREEYNDLVKRSSEDYLAEAISKERWAAQASPPSVAPDTIRRMDEFAKGCSSCRKPFYREPGAVHSTTDGKFICASCFEKAVNPPLIRTDTPENCARITEQVRALTEPLPGTLVEVDGEYSIRVVASPNFTDYVVYRGAEVLWELANLDSARVWLREYKKSHA